MEPEPEPEPQPQPPAPEMGAAEPDPTLEAKAERIVAALEQVRADEFDYEILHAASEVMGEDVAATWRPSLSYLPPERQSDGYHVTVFARGACESCPVKRLHVDSIEPKVRALVGSDDVYVHDYFDMWDFGSNFQSAE